MPTNPNTRSTEFIRLLKDSGWSQAQAARALEMTPGAVSQICHRKTRPRGSTLGLLRKVVARHQPPAPPQSELPLEPWERRMIANLRRLPPAEQSALTLVIRRMAKGSART